MRKMKKINGYLVVRFNDREKRLNAGTGLGNFGVIDAEQYTGTLDIDRAAMEYDSADTIEEAIEQARGLDAELDVEEPEVKITIVTEAETNITENEVDPVSLFQKEANLIWNQATDPNWRYINECTAPYHMRGYLSALEDLGLADFSDERFQLDYDDSGNNMPAILTPQQLDMLQKISAATLDTLPEAINYSPYQPRDGFVERARGRKKFRCISENAAMAAKLYNLGLSLLNECPNNDCTIYREIFRMCVEGDEQVMMLTGWPRRVLELQLNKRYRELQFMYLTNHAVKEYRKQHPPKSVPYNQKE